MKTVSVAEAEAQLDELIDRAVAGEVIGIARDGKVVAWLTALVPDRKPADAAAASPTATPSPEGRPGAKGAG
jgi:antitoxin (DNA-binding transcriptional repressor) of toxin-antitoxin stability system